VLAAELAALGPDVEARVEDGLAIMGWPLSSIAARGSTFDSEWGNRAYEVEYWLLSRFGPTRRFAGRALYWRGGRRLLRAIADYRADAVVSTYPGTSEVLGRLRARGRLPVPAVSAITDLAALRFWAHPGLDVHLITHPESAEEVRRIAPGTDVVAVCGLNSKQFLVPRDRDEARRDLDLPADAPVVVVSGGGWAVGDMEGAIETALAREGATVVALCGRNEAVQQRLEARFADEPRVRVMGFTDRMGDLLAAADALIHSTAGLTVLEAIVRGCPVISYGWGRGHIRANNVAFSRHGLAEVASTRPELAAALERALARRAEPDLSFAELPSAASVVLARIGRDQVRDGGGGGERDGPGGDERQ
jgi:UDP-N-acetylglucosamine:LPS N-acetylglucosamine transferase